MDDDELVWLKRDVRHFERSLVPETFLDKLRMVQRASGPGITHLFNMDGTTQQILDSYWGPNVKWTVPSYETVAKMRTGNVKPGDLVNLDEWVFESSADMLAARQATCTCELCQNSRRGGGGSGA